MEVLADRLETPRAIHTDIRAIFVSMELSRSSWLITSLSPGSGEKMSKHVVAAGNIAGLLEWLAQLKEKAHARIGRDYQIITVQEAGLDGFWIHRVLRSKGVESHVVDPASILTSRRRRRAKTDKAAVGGGRTEPNSTPPEALTSEMSVGRSLGMAVSTSKKGYAIRKRADFES